MRRIFLGIAIVSALIAVLALWLTWAEARNADRLRAEGVLVQGKLLRIDTIAGSSGSGSRSRSSAISYGTWLYQVDGREYELTDRGDTYEDKTDTVARLGPLREGQIVYLPDDPTTARLRDEIGPDLVGPLAAAGFFAFIALLLGVIGKFINRLFP